MRKALFACLGLLCFAVGMIGTVLPVLPTIPFLLLATACFAKSSRRFQDWFVGTSLYQKHLHPFAQSRAMTLKSKLTICTLATAVLLTAFLLSDNITERIVIVCALAFKRYCFFQRIKTIKPEEKVTTL